MDWIGLDWIGVVCVVVVSVESRNEWCFLGACRVVTRKKKFAKPDRNPGIANQETKQGIESEWWLPDEASSVWTSWIRMNRLRRSNEKGNQQKHCIRCHD
mmetsp:Transcript_16656/g.38278  ORF Transcript_16656/g.38278 Transcript_16656/m.38278 type:complete len:100 (-) Transcript_16656:29-328(-)